MSPPANASSVRVKPVVNGTVALPKTHVESLSGSEHPAAPCAAHAASVGRVLHATAKHGPAAANSPPDTMVTASDFILMLLRRSARLLVCEMPLRRSCPRLQSVY